MADGSTKPIEQVRVGDLVKSRNPETGLTEAKPVTETFSHLAPQVLTLAFTDPKTGAAGEQITCTPGHPFYVDGKGFVLAGQLGIGTSIVTRAGPCLTLSATAWSATPAAGNGLLLDGNTSAPGTRVYNFTVADDHTYFVGTVGGGEWVHNDSFKYPDETIVSPGPSDIDLHFPTQAAARRAAMREAGIGRNGDHDVEEVELHPWSKPAQGDPGTRTEWTNKSDTGDNPRFVHHDPWGNRYNDDPSETRGPHYGVGRKGIKGTKHFLYPSRHNPFKNRE